MVHVQIILVRNMYANINFYHERIQAVYEQVIQDSAIQTTAVLIHCVACHVTMCSDVSWVVLNKDIHAYTHRSREVY